MSGNANIDSSAATDRLLRALGEQLQVEGHAYTLIIVGGSALLALGLIARATRDVDVVALGKGPDLAEALPLPAPLVAARDRVARDFDLPGDWLNSAVAADMLRLGLPEGFTERLSCRDYGAALTVCFASRFDQIHFKLHASVDHAGGKHYEDLCALSPKPDELIAAARWARTHDPSEGFRETLIRVLEHQGVRDADLDA
jgi:hypothetical protein